jgi:hypothetical protein
LISRYHELCVKFSIDTKDLVLVENSNNIIVNEAVYEMLNMTRNCPKPQQSFSYRSSKPGLLLQKKKAIEFENLRERYSNFIKKNHKENDRYVEGLKEFDKLIREAKADGVELERRIESSNKERVQLIRRSKADSQISTQKL